MARRLVWAAAERQLAARLALQREALAERRVAVRRRLAALAEQRCLASLVMMPLLLRTAKLCCAPRDGLCLLTPPSSCKEYRGGREGQLIAYASRLKRMKTCARCMTHDKAVLGKQPTHVFLKEGHNLSCPYNSPGARAPVPTLREGVQAAERVQQGRLEGGGEVVDRSAWLLVHAVWVLGVVEAQSAASLQPAGCKRFVCGRSTQRLTETRVGLTGLCVKDAACVAQISSTLCVAAWAQSLFT